MMHRLLILAYGAACALIAIALSLRAPVFGVDQAQASFLPWYLAAHAMLLAGYATVRGSARMAEISLKRIAAAAVLAIALLGFLVIDLVVGSEGIFGWGRGGALSVILVLAAIASGAALATFFDAEDKAAPAAADDDDDEKTAAAPAVAAEGRPAPLRTAAIQIGGTLFWSAISVAGLASFTVGSFVYFALRGSLFDGEVVDIALVVRELPGLFARIWPFILVAVVVLIGYGVVTMIGRAVPQAIDRWRYPRAVRDLGPAELAFIDKASAELDAYVQERGFKRREGRLQLASFGAIALGIALLFTLVWYGDRLAMFYAPPPAVTGWHVVTYHFPGSAVPGFFLCLLLFWPLRSLIGSNSRFLSELLTWYSYSSSQRMFSLRKQLVRDVRVGKLCADAPFKPGDFLHGINMDWAPVGYMSTAALVLLIAVLWDRDARDHTLFTEDHIEVVDYWTSEAHRFPYSAAARVELECTQGRKGGWDIGYDILLPDRRINLLPNRSLLNRLADYEHVDAKLAAAGATFDFQTRTPAGSEPFIAYSTECVEETIKDLNAADGARMARLLHLADWQARSGAAR